MITTKGTYLWSFCDRYSSDSRNQIFFELMTSTAGILVHVYELDFLLTYTNRINCTLVYF